MKKPNEGKLARNHYLLQREDNTQFIAVYRTFSNGHSLCGLGRHWSFRRSSGIGGAFDRRFRRIFYEQIESIDTGSVEAITAAGARPIQVVVFGILPQVILPFLALSFYRGTSNVGMSTIIGFVGGGGIGFLLQQWINLFHYNEADTALLAIAIVFITLDTLSAKIRKRIH